MEVIINRNSEGKADRIEGKYRSVTSQWDYIAICFMYNSGRWVTSGSMCFPSNLEDTKRQIDCVAMAYAALEKIIAEEPTNE